MYYVCTNYKEDVYETNLTQVHIAKMKRADLVISLSAIYFPIKSSKQEKNKPVCRSVRIMLIFSVSFQFLLNVLGGRYAELMEP